MKNKILIISLFFLLSGCASLDDVTNPALKNKMLACSAFFGEESKIKLNGEVEKSLKSGKLKADFQDNVDNIFQSLKKIPSKDRARIYEDYIKCIENTQVTIESQPENNKKK